MPAARVRLEHAARLLLDARADPGVWRAGARALFVLCAEAGEFAPTPQSAPDEARLPQGLTLAPATAAACLLDHVRTARFLGALAAAITDARARTRAPVEVLYAGCGPFAPLFFPLTAALPRGCARFTLLDAHAASIACVRRLSAAFGAEPWLRDAAAADACDWCARQPPQVIVAEAMQAGLAHEPQVALMRALAPQLAPAGVLVPERVTLRACLADLTRERGGAASTPPPRLMLGEVVSLRTEGLRRGAPCDEPLPDDWQPADRGPRPARALPCRRLRVPAEAASGWQVAIATGVQLWGAHALGEGETGLTALHVPPLRGRVRPGATLEFRYLLGSHPRLDVRALD